MEPEKNCLTCRWHEDFTWACFNGSSPFCADFTGPCNVCPAWEAKDNRAESDTVKAVHSDALTREEAEAALRNADE